jgi:protein SCO1/2
MKKVSIKVIGLLLSRAMIGTCCQKKKDQDEGLPFFNSYEFTPEWISVNSPDYNKIHTIPAFSFTDQDGKQVTEKTVEGKIYVTNFIFTSCGSICPKMTDHMKLLQNEFSSDDQVLFLSHSVAPDKDSVAVLKEYAVEKGCISGKWHLLTGNKEAIYSLAKKEYFAGDSIGYFGKANDFLHTENFILVDTKRRIRGIYNGTVAVEMDRIIEDIKTLEKQQ